MGSGQVQLSNSNFQLNERNVPVIWSAKSGAWLRSDLRGVGKKQTSIIISLVACQAWRRRGGGVEWLQLFLSLYPCPLQYDCSAVLQLLPSKAIACFPSPRI